MNQLDKDVICLKGVGPKMVARLAKLDIYTIKDLLSHYPANYLDITNPVPIADTVIDENNVVAVTVVKKSRPIMIRRGMTIYKLVVTDDVSDMQVTIYNSQYLYDSLQEGKSYILYGKVTGNFTSREMSSPQVLNIASERILPIYHLTEGVSQKFLRECVKKALEMLDDSVEFLDEATLTKLGLVSESDAIRAIHFPSSQNDIALARKRLSFDELLTLILAMNALRTENRQATGCTMQKIPIDEFYKALPFEPTNAQKRAINECIYDMTNSVPMNRLILGDVGSGKTVIAAACCYFAYKNKMQSSLMVPTEILATQHYKTLNSLLTPLGVRVALLTGSLTAKEKSALRSQISYGDWDVVVGTHALFQDATEFKNQGLVITDEQHRFGVEQRAKLASKGNNPHKLVMSATPIPRTLALMIYGELDISYLDELPKGRKAIETYAVTGKLRSRAYDFVKARLDEGRQAYIVCPAIDETVSPDEKAVLEYAAEIQKNAFANYRVGVLHGKMPSSDKDRIMSEFKDGKIDILVATSVVEVGVDVSNAAVMLIENADRFGLSQLHQLRGRVGRGQYQSYCILISDNPSEVSRQRLKILASTHDGFAVSQADLDMRGPGDFFGSAQHGLPKLKIAALADSDTLKLAQTAADMITASRFISPALQARVKNLLANSVES